VGGACITRGKIQAHLNPNDFPGLLLGRSGSDGSFLIHDLAAEPQELTAVHAEHGLASAMVTPSVGEPAIVNFTFGPSGQLAGIVTFAGTPTRAAVLVYEGQDTDRMFGWFHAEDDGSYRITGIPAGNYQVHIRVPQDVQDARWHIVRNLRIGTGTSGLSYDFQQGATTLTGAITEDGVPVNATVPIQVEYVGEGLYCTSAVKIENGEYAIDGLLPGQVAVRRVHEGGSVGEQSIPLTLPQNGTVTLNFDIASAELPPAQP
jgi:hypothetical protein